MSHLTIHYTQPPPREIFLQALTSVGYNKHHIKLIGRAYEFSKYGHNSQTRDDGSPYFDHPAWMAAYVVMTLKIVDFELVITCLIHDLREESQILTFCSIWENFGLEIAECNAALTKDKTHPYPMDDSLQRCLAVNSWKAAFAKSIDRLHNSRTLTNCTLEKVRRKNQETKTLFSDNETGLLVKMKGHTPPKYHQFIDDIKTELADLSLQHDQYITDLERLR